MYPADESFLQNVKQEIIYQIRRLSHHPCIALWSGNNENEEGLYAWNECKKNKEKLLIDYYKLYYDTIYETLKNEDPSRPFWPSSPSNGPYKWGNPQDMTQGDAHYWGVWHRNLPFTEYLKIIPRFCSEFGFQSIPSFESLEPYLEPEEDYNITAPGFEFRQRSPLVGNKSILEHISREFRMPKGFKETIYVSQLLQMIAIKTACEHFRRTSVCKGALYWQLNDSKYIYIIITLNSLAWIELVFIGI